jgi:hypothetical protein
MSGTKLRCPSKAQVAEFEDAVRNGDIRWHAFPHNSEPEMLDVELFKYGVQLTVSLAARFNLVPPAVMLQRDVPSMTRGVVPLLHEAGVIGINVGINGASAPVAVPSVAKCTNGEISTPFLWRDNSTNTSTIASFHPGDYGRLPGNSGQRLLCDCIAVEGVDEALCCGWRGDNEGGPTVDEVKKDFAILKAAFPSAAVEASTLDAYCGVVHNQTPALLASGALPTVDMEMGDSWVYGCASDPWKMAAARVMMRARTNCVRYGLPHLQPVKAMVTPTTAAADTLLIDTRCSPDRIEGWEDFSRLLLKVSEHTWGLDGRCNTEPQTSWPNKDFELIRSTPMFTQQEFAWGEQRQYLTKALAALNASAPFAQSIAAEIALLRRPVPVPAGDAAAKDGAARPVASAAATDTASRVVVPLPKSKWGEAISIGSFVVQVDVASGALIGLTQTSLANDSTSGVDPAANHTYEERRLMSGGREWASSKYPIGRWVYQTHDKADGERFMDTYLWRKGISWAGRVFEKLGLTDSMANETTSTAAVVGMWKSAASGGGRKRSASEGGGGEVDEGDYLLLQLQPSTEAYVIYGAPKTIWLRYTADATSSLAITLTYENKTTTRLPESHWIEFRPLPAPRPSGRAGAEAQSMAAGERAASETTTVHTATTALALQGIRVDKLGSMVDPAAVILNGSRTLHAVGDGGVVFQYGSKAARRSDGSPPESTGGAGGSTLNMTLTSLDAALVSPGLSNMDLYLFPGETPRADDGVAINLFNNLWSVNYVFWYPFDLHDSVINYRFLLAFPPLALLPGAAAAVASPALPTAVRLIRDDPDLRVMYAWLGAAGLLHGALDHPLSGPFTVLAPTDEAFATLSNATKAHWLDPANADALTVLMENWMVPAKVCTTCRPRA